MMPAYSLILFTALTGVCAAAAPESQPLTAKAPAVQEAFTILFSAETMQDAAWRNVVLALQAKHRNAGRTVTLMEVKEWTEEELTRCLKAGKSRYAAVVAKPQEVNRVLFMNIHRASRRMDDDPWGDCLCGVITGHEPEDALRVAVANKPLVMKRLLATTNVDASRFEHSYCITDWTGAPILEQSGYTEPTQTLFDPNTPEGKEKLTAGLQKQFAEQLETARPQMIVSSSHATQFNLEMPFGLGVIIPSGGEFYQASPEQLSTYKKALRAAYSGKGELHRKWVEEQKLEPIKPDGEPRIWLAAGNCLFGDAYNSAESMSVTALSNYTCNQVVGYTVPSWYGEGGWGTMGTLLGNAEGTSLAEAWFLNNQFILHRTHSIAPALLNVRFSDREMTALSQRQMLLDMQKEQIDFARMGNYLRDSIGLIHDRDVVAFYGDPTWKAVVNESNTKPAFRITWNGNESFTVSSEKGGKARIGILFPASVSSDKVKGCDAEDAVFTNDYILFNELELAPGASRTVNLKFQE